MGEFTYGRAAGTDEALACVRAVYDAFARRDEAAMMDLLAEDFEIVPVGTQRLSGRTAPYRGHEGVREYLADVQRLWSALTLSPEDFRAVGDSVIVFGHARGVAEDRAVARRAVWTWRVRDGKAVSVRVSDVGGADPETPGRPPGPSG